MLDEMISMMRISSTSTSRCSARRSLNRSLLSMSNSSTVESMMSSVSTNCGPTGDAGGGADGMGETFESESPFPMEEKMPRPARTETEVKPRVHTMRQEMSTQFCLGAIAF